MRHPGLQHQMRMKELAELLASSNLEVISLWRQYRELESKAADLHTKIVTAELKKTVFTNMQRELIESTSMNDYGLPLNMTRELYETMTNKRLD